MVLTRQAFDDRFCHNADDYHSGDCRDRLDGLSGKAAKRPGPAPIGSNDTNSVHAFGGHIVCGRPHDYAHDGLTTCWAPGVLKMQVPGRPYLMDASTKAVGKR